MARVGVLLSGCGRYDGTDIHEAVLALLALDRANARIECLAPSSVRTEAVDHATGQLAEGEFRDVLVEAARLARGRITPIPEARIGTLQALIIPGGQGIARSLMKGAGEPGRKREADLETAGLIRGFLEQKKPIGAISLGSALTATVLGLPLDEDPFSMPATGIRIDEAHGIVWTPGFLSSDRISQIAQGIEAMVAEVLQRGSGGLQVID